VLAVLALVLVGGCGRGPSADSGSAVSGVSVHDTDNLHGIVLPKAYTVPDVRLEDVHGQPYDLARAATRPLTLVFFGYTHCPDICQVVMANLASAMTRLDAAQRKQVATVFVTTDPQRDTAATLRAYVARFDPSFQGATGPLSSIVRLGKAVGVPIQRGAKLPSGGYDVEHGTQVIGVVPGARAPYVWTEGTDPSALADDITTILDGKVRSE
jgi:protein SCO1/2